MFYPPLISQPSIIKTCSIFSIALSEEIRPYTTKILLRDLYEFISILATGVEPERIKALGQKIILTRNFDKLIVDFFNDYRIKYGLTEADAQLVCAFFNNPDLDQQNKLIHFAQAIRHAQGMNLFPQKIPEAHFSNLCKAFMQILENPAMRELLAVKDSFISTWPLIDLNRYAELLSWPFFIQMIERGACSEEDFRFLLDCAHRPELKQTARIALNDPELLSIPGELSKRIREILSCNLYFPGLLPMLTGEFKRNPDTLFIPRALPILNLEKEMAELEKVLHAFRTVSDDVPIPLSEEKMRHIYPICVEVINLRVGLQNLSQAELDATRSHAILTKNSALLAATLSIQIARIFGYYPHVVQMVNLLLLVQEERHMARIGTGEGKSTVIVLLASYLALLKQEKVAILITEETLTQRDYLKFKPYFDSLMIGLGNVCDGYYNTKTFRPQVLMGRVSDYEFALQGDMISPEGREISNRRLVEITAEQAGSLTIPEYEYTFDSAASRVYEEVRVFSTYMPSRYVKIVDEIDNMGIDQLATNSVISAPQANLLYTAKLYHTLWTADREHGFNLTPALLKTTIYRDCPELRGKIRDTSFEKWTLSIYKAKNLKRGKHYIIQDSKIVIVDQENTGAILKGQVWSDGVYALVCAREGLTVRAETPLSGSISHFSFFGLDGPLYALSGTTYTKEGDIDHVILCEILKMQAYFSPPHLPSQRTILSDVFVSRDDYEATFAQQAIRYQQAGHPVLLILETIDQSQKLYDMLLSTEMTAVQLYNGLQKDGEAILERAGHPGVITVATNFAGRGTDIVAEHLVVLMGPSTNARVEKQAQGRAGRQGRPGLVQSILCEEDLRERFGIPADEAIDGWRKNRDYHNAIRQLNSLSHLPKFEVLFAALLLFAKISAESRALYAREWELLYTKWHDFYTTTSPEDFKKSIIYDAEVMLENIDDRAGISESIQALLRPYTTVEAFFEAYLERGVYASVMTLCKDLNRVYRILELDPDKKHELPTLYMGLPQTTLVAMRTVHAHLDSLLGLDDMDCTIPPKQAYTETIKDSLRERYVRKINKIKELEGMRGIEPCENIQLNLHATASLFSSLNKAFLSCPETTRLAPFTQETYHGMMLMLQALMGVVQVASSDSGNPACFETLKMLSRYFNLAFEIYSPYEETQRYALIDGGVIPTEAATAPSLVIGLAYFNEPELDITEQFELLKVGLPH